MFWVSYREDDCRTLRTLCYDCLLCWLYFNASTMLCCYQKSLFCEKYRGDSAGFPPPHIGGRTNAAGDACSVPEDIFCVIYSVPYCAVASTMYRQNGQSVDRYISIRACQGRKCWCHIQMGTVPKIIQNVSTDARTRELLLHLIPQI